MKKILSLFVLMTIGFCAATQIAVAQEQRDDFARMTFDVSLNKNTYLLLEPLQVKFKFANQTNQPQKTYTPLFSQESSLKVMFNGLTTHYDTLSSIRVRTIRFAGIFAPGKVYEEEEILATGLEAFFPQAGKYQIQFVLKSSSGVKTLESSVIDVTIEEPTGLNKQAFDFLRTHQSSSDLFGWIYDKEIGQNLLETFVEKYGDSVYGELGISNLGYTYKFQDELEKAEALFKKLESSKNKSVAADAKRALAEIKRKTEEKNKSNNH